MTSRVLVLLVSLAVLGATAPLRAGQVGDEPQFRVRIETSNLEALRESLERAGYDVLGTDPTSSTIEVAVSRYELYGLQSRGLSVVSVERGHPLQATPTKKTMTSGQELAVTAAAVSAGYLNLDGINARLRQIAESYPAIAQLVDVTATYNAPPTFEGRHIYALKISDNVSVDEDEPAMLVAATHHAREISTPVIALEAADRLTTGYDTDPRITEAVNSHEIWIAPVWNPDGYNYVFTGNNLWRKNRRVFSTGVGVDQNRNYPQAWATSCAGSTSVGSETYKGPSAASEPETRTMMAWSETERFAKVIDYHSYGREVLYAYRCLSHPFTAWMQQEAAALSVASGYGGHTRVPSAEGEHQQWQFAQARSLCVPHRDAHRVPAVVRERAQRGGDRVAGDSLGYSSAQSRYPVTSLTRSLARLWPPRSNCWASRSRTARPTAAAARSARTTCSSRREPTTSGSRATGTRRQSAA